MEMKSTLEVASEKRRRRIQRQLWAKHGSRKSVDPEGNGVVLIAHSLGNVVFRYFCDWLLNEVGATNFQEWMDKNIYMLPPTRPYL